MLSPAAPPSYTYTANHVRAVLTLDSNTIQVSGPPTPEPSSPVSVPATIDNADIIGFTLAGGPIVRLANAVPSAQWGNPELMAMTDGGRPLLVFGPAGVQPARRGDENV